MKVIFVYYSNPYGKTEGVSVSSCALIEEFGKRGIGCYAAYVYDTNTTHVLQNLDGELVLPNQRMDHPNNIISLAKYIANHNIDIVINQGGAFEEVTKLCVGVKNRVGVKLYSVIRRSPKCYISSVVSSLRTPVVAHGIRSLLGRVFVICLFPALYLRALIKTRRFLSRLVRESDVVICLSKSYLKYIQHGTRLFNNRSRLHCIANSLERTPHCDDIARLEKKKNIIYVGRLQNSVKRVDMLLRVWHVAQNSLPGWSLQIIGDGGDLSSLKHMASCLKLKNVYFHGFVDPRQQYEKASILCLTSLHEGFGRVLIEAQSYGVIPFAFSSFDAVYDIIDDGVTGIMVKPFDIEEYAMKLVEIAGDSSRREMMSRKAQKSSQRYSSSIIGDQWMELFTMEGFEFQ